MANEDKKIDKAVINNKLNQYGVSKRALISGVSVIACVVLIIVMSVVQAGFDWGLLRDTNYWINLTILCALTIFGMISGQQIGDDISRNNINGQYRKSLFNYKNKFKLIDDKKLFAYFEDWLFLFREAKLAKKIETVLKDNGIHQLEVLDLDISELSELATPGFKKDWSLTEFKEKYFDAQKGESATYFLSYTEEQINIIKSCKTGMIKVSPLSSSFFLDAFTKNDKDMWESSAKAEKKKGLFVGTNYTYKLVFLFIINFILTGIMPGLQGADAKTIWLTLISRTFALCMAVVWGIYIGMEIVKIDTSYIGYKTLILGQYFDECESRIYVPKTIEEKAKILYEKRHSAEEKVDKIEEEVADEQERILD